jgi:SH3 domain protein
VKTARRCLAVLLAATVWPALAETEYVTDKLRLGVHLTRDTSGTPFTYLNSGDAVEVLEREGRLTFVELPDERTGWVRGTFLQPEEPALRRIGRVDAENERLAAEVASLRSDDSAAEIDRLTAAAAAANERADAAEDERLSLQSELRSLREQLSALQSGVPLSWLLAGVALAFMLGAFAAWRWFDYRSRRRHGGFRIY